MDALLVMPQQKNLHNFIEQEIDTFLKHNPGCEVKDHMFGISVVSDSLSILQNLARMLFHKYRGDIAMRLNNRPVIRFACTVEGSDDADEESVLKNVLDKLNKIFEQEQEEKDNNSFLGVRGKAMNKREMMKKISNSSVSKKIVIGWVDDYSPTDKTPSAENINEEKVAVPISDLANPEWHEKCSKGHIYDRHTKSCIPHSIAMQIYSPDTAIYKAAKAMMMQERKAAAGSGDMPQRYS